MRVVFFGTPDVAVAALEMLLASPHAVVAVVTQPDKERGRGRSVSASPVKELAVRAGLPVLQPATPKQDGFADSLRAYAPDALAVVAYGHILPRAVLDVAPAMNVHFSLLPRYRGAAPVQRALMDGVTETGVSVFLLEPTVDTGPVLRRRRVPVGEEDTAGDVFTRLAPLGASLLLEALDALDAGAITPEPQDDTVASPAPKIKPEETIIDWRAPAATIANLVRGLNPRPGAHTSFRGKRLLIWRARVTEDSGVAGTIVGHSKDGFTIAAGVGALEIVEVQLEGKRAMSAGEFVRGYRPVAGDRLG